MIITDETIIDNNLKVNGKMIVDFDKMKDMKNHSFQLKVIDITSDNIENIVRLFHHHITFETEIDGATAIVCFDFFNGNPESIDDNNFETYFQEMEGNTYIANGGSTLGTVVSKCYWVYEVQINDPTTITIKYMQGNSSPMETDITPTSITDYVHRINI